MPKSSSLTTCLPPALHDEDVAGLEIAVDDALVVRRLQRRADGLEDLVDLLGREAAALVEHRAQVGALEQLHDVERAPVGQLAELVDVHDVRVLDHVDGERLAQEARHHLRRGRELAPQHLDGGLAPEEPVLRLVDGAAAARRELLLEDVGARERAGLQLVGVDGLAMRARGPDWGRAPVSCRRLPLGAWVRPRRQIEPASSGIGGSVANI